MITKTYGKDFYSNGGALTLSPSIIGENNSGWTITGKIHEDYYHWVNKSSAHHPTLGRVWGDFEDKVFATSKVAFDDFYLNHKPEAWDYMDI